MKRSNIHFAFLLLWLFALIVPPTISLLDSHGNTEFSINLNEEEQQEQGKKNPDEEKIVREAISDYSLLSSLNKSEMGIYYFLSHTDYTQEILLPPPERSI